MLRFTKATKAQAKARIAIIGPSGSGKTYTALKIATGLGDNVAVIDTENGTASKYADEFNFSTLNLAEFSPQTYIEAINEAVSAGFDALIIDSLSHAWMGKGGALEQVDKAAKRYQNNSFAAWRDVTPVHNSLVEALVQCKIHLIVTMRSKTDYILDRDEKTGKTTPRKVGLAPVQRDGLEYEFDIVGDMDIDHNIIISKTRCRVLDGAVINKPDSKLAGTVKAWLTDGVKQPIAHWSDDPENRAKIEAALTKQGIPLQALFDTFNVTDWAEINGQAATGKEALEKVKAYWTEHATKPVNELEKFCQDVYREIPFFASPEQVKEVMAEIGMNFDPTDTEGLMWELSQIASQQADKAAG